MLTDTLGLVLRVVITTANVQDKAGALLTLKSMGGAGKKLRRIWADGAYRTAQGYLAAWLARQRISLQAIQPPEGQRGFAILPRRWVVERTFGLALSIASVEQRLRAVAGDERGAHLRGDDSADVTSAHVTLSFQTGSYHFWGPSAI